MTRKDRKALELHRARRQEAIDNAFWYFIEGDAAKVKEMEQEAIYENAKCLAIIHGKPEPKGGLAPTRRGKLMEEMKRKDTLAILERFIGPKKRFLKELEDLYPESVELAL